MPQELTTGSDNHQRNEEALLNSLSDSYVFRTKLSRGAFGTVYLAKARDDTDVVIKVIEKRSDLDETNTQRLLDKINSDYTIPLMFDHPNIVKILDYVDTETYAYLVYPYVSDSKSITNLSNQELNNKSISNIVKLIEYVEQVCRAIKVLHNQNVVHRDIKPHNIVVARDLAFLIDFDLSAVLDDGRLTAQSNLSGTPNYLAPEMWHPQTAVDYKLADIYSLGVTMFYIFNNRSLPYKASFVDDLEYKIQNYEPISSASGIRELDMLIMKTIQKVPRNRPSIDLIERSLSFIKTKLRNRLQNRIRNNP